MAEFNIDIELQNIRKELQAVQGELKAIEAAGVKAFTSIGTSAKKAGDETEKLFAPEGGSAIKEAQAIEDLRAEYAKLERAAKTLKGALNQAQDPRAIKQYTAALAQAQAGLKKLGDTGKAVGVNLKDTNKQLSIGRSIASELLSSFSVAGAVAGVVALTKRAVELAANYEKVRVSFTSFLGSAEKADKLLTDLNKFATATPFDDAQVRQAGKSLLGYGVAAENIIPILDRLGNISAGTGKDFNELVAIYGKARIAGNLYAEDINQLLDANIDVVTEFSNQLGRPPEEIKKLASEGKISFAELELAFLNLTSQGGKFYGQMTEQSKTLLGQTATLKSEFDNTLRTIGEGITPALVVVVQKLNDFLAALKSIGDFGGATVFERVSNSVLLLSGGLLNLEKLLDRIKGKNKEAGQTTFFTKEQIEEGKKNLKEREDLEAKAAADRGKITPAELEKRKREYEKYLKELEEIERLRIESLADGQEKEIALETLKFKEFQKELAKYHIDSSAAEAEYQEKVLAIKIKYSILALQEQQEAILAEQDAIQRGYDETLQITEEGEKQLADTARKNRETDNQRAELRAASFEGQLLVERRVFFERQRTAEEIAAFEEDVAKRRELFDLEQQKAAIERTLAYEAQLNELTEAEKATLEQRAKNINEQIKQIQDGIGGEGDEEQKSVLENLFGLTPDEVEKVKDSVGQIIGSIEQLTQARVDAANAAVAASERTIEAAQEALDREIEIAQLGYANNVDARRKDLEDAEAARKQALEQQRKAQRAQLVIDAAQQASSIAVSSANLIKSWSSLPFGVGLVAAFAQVAQLVALIKSVKARAASFGEGGGGRIGTDGVIVGPSHDSGGVPMEVEGGEFFHTDGKAFAVVKKKSTKKYYNLLQAINRDDMPGIAEQVERLTGGTRMAENGIRTIEAGAGARVAVSGDPEAKELLREQNRLLKEQLKIEREKTTYVDMGAYVLRTKNGVETKLYKR